MVNFEVIHNQGAYDPISGSPVQKHSEWKRALVQKSLVAEHGSFGTRGKRASIKCFASALKRPPYTILF